MKAEIKASSSLLPFELSSSLFDSCLEVAVLLLFSTPNVNECLLCEIQIQIKKVKTRSETYFRWCESDGV